MIRVPLIFCLLLTISKLASADIVTLSPVAEGDITNFPPLSYSATTIHDVFISGSGQETRSIAEFDLSSILAGRVNVATLSFTEFEDQGRGTQIQVHGYVADGVGDTSDFFNVTNPIGAAGYNDGSNGLEQLDVTSQIQSLVTNGEANAGFLWQRLSGNDADFNYVWRNPRLRIDFTPVPEPSFFPLFGLGLFVLTFWRRNSRRRPEAFAQLDTV